MKRMIDKIFKLSVFLVMFYMFIACGQADAAVSVGFNFNFGAPPQEIILVPGNVYYVPDRDADVFFYNEYWWTIRNNHWYKSRNYNGSWMMIDPNFVPSSVTKVYWVPNYKKYYQKKGGRHVSYEKWNNQSKHRGFNKEGK